MFGETFQRKYALTDQGVKNTKQATLWTVIVNLVVMGGMGILYMMMTGYMETLTGNSPLPGAGLFLILVLVFVVLSIITHLQQYRATYGLVYGEVKNVRIALAERMRKLPLGYFGKRDLADLTETIMGDVNRLEHVWSHCLGYLYGSYISTAIVAIMLLIFDWRLSIACLWGVPVAFILLFGSRKINKSKSEITKEAGIQVSDGIQETLENIREIRATNQEDRFLKELNDKIDYHEKTMLSGELSCGIFVNAASVIMRLGVATTILTGTGLILSGKVDFMVLFMFLLVITRVYAPFDQALALIAEMLMSQISASRLMEIHDTKTADGADVFKPEGHDIVFDNVGFAYDSEKVLEGVSFVAKEGEVTALVGPSGSGKSTCAKLAARLWDIPEGTIKVGGVDINSVDPEVLLTDYSMVFQDVVLFDDTVMENIRLGKHGATDEEVKAIIKDIRVIARALPTDKSRMVKLCQEMNLVVGMTGDGVNDSPALKRADVGFAMGSGTEAAKEAGEIVVIDDNFKSIKDAILYGRTIYRNILKFCKFQLVINVAAVIVSAISPFFGIVEPLKVTHLLFVNLVMDSLGAIMLGNEPALEKYMTEPPRRRDESIISRSMAAQILVMALWLTVVSFAFLKMPVFLHFFGTEEKLHTAYFVLFVVAALFNGFNVRDDGFGIFEGFKENPGFLKVWFAIVFAQALIVNAALIPLSAFGWISSMFSCTPFGLGGWGLIIIIAATMIPVDFIRKTILLKLGNDKSKSMVRYENVYR